MPVLPDKFVLMNDELWGLAAWLFGNKDPCSEVNDNAGAEGEERERGPDEADDRGIGVKMVSDPGTDSGDHAALLRADKLFHTG